MNIKSFRSLVQSKTGLSNEEYNQLFDALQEKYNVTEEGIASQVPDSFGNVSSSMALNMALPSTANDDVQLTRYDKSIAEKLDIDPEIVGKITQWGEAASSRLETLDDIPFGVGDQIREAVDANGIGEFMGSQRDIGKAIDGRLAPEVENTAEGATADAQKETTSFWDRIKDRLDGREAEEGTVKLDKGFDYYNEEAGVALRGVGDSMRVYLINEDGKTELVGSVECARENREEFVSEYQEQVSKVAEAGDSFWEKVSGSKEMAAMGVAQDVSKDIAEEHEIGTGNWLHDVIRDKTQEKYENLQDSVEKMEDKIEEMDDGWLKDMMTKTLEKAQTELEGYEAQLAEFDKMEVENAKEIKAEVEAAKEQLQEQMDKIDNMSFFPDSIKDMMKSNLEGQMDELDDRLNAVNSYLAENAKEGTVITPEVAQEQKTENSNWLEEFRVNCVEKADEAKEWVSDALTDVRSKAQTFVANVDNIVGGVRDNVAEWASSVANNEHVQNFSETVNNFYTDIQDDLDGIKSAAKDFGKGLGDDAGKLWEDIKDVAQDVGKDIADKWDNAVDNAKEWAKDLADKFDFDREDDVATSIDD